MAQSYTLNLAYFHEQWQLTQKMLDVLHYSFERAKLIAPLFETDGGANISLEQAEILEALTARFARLVDNLTQKLFRAIDAIELIDEGSLLDRFNRMEKRGIVPSVEQLIEIRQLRNQIAHDYALEDLIPLYQSVFYHCEKLFNIVNAIANYIGERGWK